MSVEGSNDDAAKRKAAFEAWAADVGKQLAAAARMRAAGAGVKAGDLEGFMREAGPLCAEVMDWFRREALRQTNVRQLEPMSLVDFTRRWRRHMGAGLNRDGLETPNQLGMEPWQSQGLVEAWLPFILGAIARLGSRVPERALLVTLLGEGPAAFSVAADEEATGLVDVVPDLKTAEIAILDGRVQVASIRPKVNSLGYVFCLFRPTPVGLLEFPVLVWDVRPLLALARHERDLQQLLRLILHIGPLNARTSRSAFVSSVGDQVAHEIVRLAAMDEIMDPRERTKRVPLRGLMQKGFAADLDTSGTFQPFHLLQVFDRGRSAQEREIADADSSDCADPRKDFEQVEVVEFIQRRTAHLPDKTRDAMRHFLMARLLRATFREYCEARGLNYSRLRKLVSLAAPREILRPTSP